MNFFYNLPSAYQGLLLSIGAGLATGLGALPLLIIRRKLSERTIDVSLSLAAGVMLAAAVYSLILPSLEYGGIPALVIGLVAGVLFVDFVDKKIPHIHFIKGPEGPEGPEYPSKTKHIFLFVLTIFIHNFPEGLAVGIGGFSNNSFSLASAISIHNLLEGLAVAAALVSLEYKVSYSVWIAFLSGLVEPLGAVVGVTLISFSSVILPYAFSFAGGAMLFVISDEVIPETHAGNNQRLATYAILIGFLLMTILEHVLG